MAMFPDARALEMGSRGAADRGDQRGRTTMTTTRRTGPWRQTARSNKEAAAEPLEQDTPDAEHDPEPPLDEIDMARVEDSEDDELPDLEGEDATDVPEELVAEKMKRSGPFRSTSRPTSKRARG